MLLQTPSLLVVGSLVPVVGGVVLASMTEVSFNWLVVSTISKFPVSKDWENFDFVVTLFLYLFMVDKYGMYHWLQYLPFLNFQYQRIGDTLTPLYIL